MVPQNLSNLFHIYDQIIPRIKADQNRMNYSRVMGGKHIFTQCKLLGLPCSLPEFMQSTSNIVMENEYIGHFITKYDYRNHLVTNVQGKQ